MTQTGIDRIKGMLILIGVIYVFLLSLELILHSLGMIGVDTARQFLSITDNPFIALFTGLLITAIIQSSSTTTSLIVTAVAAGSLEYSNAVMMIMGANIGTTLTSSLIALGYLARKAEYRRALSAGTVHDFYNILTACILFPLEYYYGLLSWSARIIGSQFTGNLWSYPDQGHFFDIALTTPVVKAIENLLPNPIFPLLLAAVLLFISIKIISNTVSSRMLGRKGKLNELLFKNRWKSFAFGTVLTAGIQSSSITTSLMVPLAAAGRLRLQEVFPFILGANLGTTFTALFASLFISPEAINIAIVHLLFNAIGVTIFMIVPRVNKLPTILSWKLSEISYSKWFIGVLYIVLVFFLIPFSLIYFAN